MRFLPLVLLICGLNCVPPTHQYVNDAGPRSARVPDRKQAFSAAMRQVAMEGLTVKVHDEASGLIQTEWSDLYTTNFGSGTGASQFRLLVTISSSDAVVAIQCQIKGAPTVAQAMLASATEIDDQLAYEPCDAEYASNRPAGWKEIQERVVKAIDQGGSPVAPASAPAAGAL